MISFKHSFFIVLIAILLQACRGREVDIALNFEGEKLVLWGQLDAGKPVKIQVSKTFEPLGVLPEELYINTAKVSLYKNDSLISQLKSLDAKGNYGSDIIIDAGGSYVVKAEAEGFLTAESEAILVPSSVPAFRYSREGSIEPEVNLGIQQELITFYLEQAESKYLMLAIYAHYNEFAVASQRPSKKNIMANEEDCHTWTNFSVNPQYFMMNTACASENTPLSFFVEVESNIVLPNGQPINSRANRISMELVSISREWFEYNKIERKQPEGLDHLVLPPQKAYTNVKNGYGLIYGSLSLKSDLM